MISAFRIDSGQMTGFKSARVDEWNRDVSTTVLRTVSLSGFTSCYADLSFIQIG